MFKGILWQRKLPEIRGAQKNKNKVRMHKINYRNTLKYYYIIIINVTVNLNMSPYKCLKF